MLVYLQITCSSYVGLLTTLVTDRAVGYLR